MPLTVLSRFSRVTVSFDPISRLPRGIRAYTDESDPEKVSVSFQDWTAQITDGELALGILQDIYASDARFRDSDGNAVTVYIESLALNVDELEPNGYPNPLIAGFAQRFRNRVAVDGALLMHAEVERDATSGRTDIKTTGGIVPQKGSPQSGTLAQGLGDWTAEVLDLQRVIFRINPLPGQRFDIGDANSLGTAVSDDVRVRAMIKELNDLIHSGDDLYDDLDEVEGWGAAIFSGRQFSLNQDSGTNAFRFTISTTTAGPQLLTLVAVKHSSSPNDYDVDKINVYLNEKVVSFVTDDEEEKAPFGSKDVPIEAERIILPDAEIITVRGVPTIKTSTRRISLGSVYGSVIRWNDLEVVSGETWRKVPFYFNLRSIHIESTVDRVIRIPDPPDIVPNQNDEIEFEIHNNNDYTFGKSVEVQDARGNNLITLLGREHVILRVEWFKDGSGEIRSPQRVPRVLTIAGNIIGPFTSVGYWERSTSEWSRPIPFPGVGASITSPLRINEEAFEIGTASIVNGSSFSSVDLHVPQSFKVKKLGRLSYDLQLVISGEDSGSISSHSLNLVEYDGGSNFLLADYPQVPLTVNETRPWDIFWSDEGGNVDIGDVILPIYRYAKSSTMSPTDVHVRSYRLAVTLLQDILVEFTP